VAASENQRLKHQHLQRSRQKLQTVVSRHPRR
jgi:hypothetical protein